MQVLTDLKSEVLVAANPFRDQAIPNYSCAWHARDRPSRYGEGRDFRRTVVRGPVPRNAWPPCRCANRFFARRLFRSFRTLISIEKRVGFVFKVRKDLNNERRA